MKHALDLDVGDVPKLAVDFIGDDSLRNRVADHFVFGGLLRESLALGHERVAVAFVPLELELEILSADQIAVPHVAIGRADHRNDAVLHDELLHGRAKLLRGAVQEHAAGL